MRGKRGTPHTGPGLMETLWKLAKMVPPVTASCVPSLGDLTVFEKRNFLFRPRAACPNSIAHVCLLRLELVGLLGSGIPCGLAILAGAFAVDQILHVLDAICRGGMGR